MTAASPETRAAERCHVGLSRLQAGAPGGAFYRTRGATVSLTAVPTPRLNAVLQARFPAGEARTRVAAVVERVAGERPAFGWVVWPTSAPPGLPRVLRAAGARHVVDMKIMATPLAAAARRAPAVEGLAVRRVRTAADLERWVDVSLGAFGDAPSQRPSVLAMERAVGLAADCPRLLFLGSVRGRPVATSMVYTLGRACGLSYVGVLPRWRGKGVGAAMTQAALDAARSRGCRTATLLATGMGEAVYRRLGFKVHGKARVFGFGGAKAAAR